MASVIDYNAIAASVYKTVLGLNTIATDLVGLDCAWCRLLPYDNGADIVIQEYTLHSYDCPKQFKVITTNTEYQIGNYMVDLWGVHQEVPLEINVDIKTWNQIYGDGTMPQKGDFVLFSLLHKAFEVKSSSIVYTVGEQPTSYKCQLGVWQHNANRMESEEFTQSINDITDSQDRLFGDEISKEVADAVVEVETSFNNTTYVDPLKTFDVNSVVEETIYGEYGNTISNAYYDFNEASQNVIYNVAAKYDKSTDEKHWIFSCWFKNTQDNNIQSGTIKIGELLLKEKDYWTFKIQSEIKLEIGDEVTIYCSGIIKLNGIIDTEECNNSYVIKIKTSDCLKVSKKYSLWWKQGKWRIQKCVQYNIITGYNEDEITYKIQLDQNNLVINAGSINKKINIKEGKSLDFSNWHYLMIDMGPSNTNIVLVKQQINQNNYSKFVIINKNVKIPLENFEFDSLCIENEGNDICMCNIRLYESEQAIGDAYNIDMYSEVTKNASKLILVDKPQPVNDMSFVTPVK